MSGFTDSILAGYSYQRMNNWCVVSSKIRSFLNYNLILEMRLAPLHREINS
jgi:hypothetical protein